MKRKQMAVKTEWDLSVFYKSKKDPKIGKDVERIKRAYISFEKKYRNRSDYLKSEKALLQALRDYEKLATLAGSARPLMYFHYTKELNSRDQEAYAKLTKLSHELTVYGNKILFFHLKLGKIPQQQQRKFLKSKLLAPYRYDLQNLFEDSKYDLSEAEEKIISLKSLPSYELWVEGHDKLLNKQVVSFKGQELPIAEASNKVNNLPTKERRGLQDAILKKLHSISDFSESELNAVAINKNIGDELRGYKEPYSATIRHYENDEKSILNLIDTVTKRYRISHRFYKLKAKMLGLKTLAYADRSARIGKVKTTFPFKQSAHLLLKVLESIDTQYAGIFERFLARGQIDVYSEVGKSGGAYCSGSTNNPTFVLLNHTNSFNSFSTLAHEMGHAIHTEMAKTQPVRYQGYSTSVAETASTLFETLTFEYLFEQLSEKEKVIALHDKINDDISTVFRQVSFFNFELELHRGIREQGSLSKESIAKLLNKHSVAYLGPAFKLKDLDGYFFVQVPHFRNFFYVYSYVYGQLISKVMVARFLADNSYRKQIKEFLCAGRSKSPEQIFKDIGIDTAKPSFFKEGLESIESDIARLEKLVKERHNK